MRAEKTMPVARVIVPLFGMALVAASVLAFLASPCIGVLGLILGISVIGAAEGAAKKFWKCPNCGYEMTRH